MKFLIYSIFILYGFSASAQNEFVNNGADLYITTGATLQVNGKLTNEAGGTLVNNGVVTVTGDLVNNQMMPAPNSGTLIFNGNMPQLISGASAYFAKNVTVNNPAGVTLNTSFKVDGNVTFTTGDITSASSSAALVITSNGTVTGVNDNSHVNGYVTKEGTGNFSYPVGDGTRYEKVDINLSSNSSGMRVKYNPADAGAAPFTAGGSEPVPLASYNTNEFWDATPLSSATGTVRIYWDGYKDSYSNPVIQRRVAHKFGGNWLNEGNPATAMGTTASGSVTSNAISNWSPFALGTVVTVLPVKWLSLTGNINPQGFAALRWEVEETNVANYAVEKSNDGFSYKLLEKINSVGDGLHIYQATDPQKLLSTSFYRILQTDNDGRTSYSPIVKIKATNTSVKVYPTVFNSGFNVLTDAISVARLTDLQGKLIKTIRLSAGNNYIPAEALAKGIYILILESGLQQRIIKQ